MIRAALTTFLLVAGPSIFNPAAACEDQRVAHPHPDAAPAASPVDAGDIALEMIRDRVLRRCGLSGRLAENKLPWYFHYEYGVELIREGAASHAIEPLQMTANLRSRPARDARMYGMWFVDYLPYYQISKAWSKLGEWDLAWDALVMSESFREFSPRDRDYEQYLDLKKLIESHRESAG